MSSSLPQFLGKLRNAEKTLQTSRSKALQQAGQVARGAFLGAPGAPHKVAGRPTTVSARPNGQDAIAVRWNGPAHLVDRDTKPHQIRPKGFVGTRSTGAKAQKGAALLGFFGVDARSSIGAVKLSDGALRSVVDHPGTRGKHFFEKGRDAAIPLVGKAYQRVTHMELAKVFGG